MPPKIVLRTWRDVYGFLHSLMPSLTDASSRLLVGQFMQFLEYGDMSGFTGWRDAVQLVVKSFQRSHNVVKLLNG
jgi:hypothetical protein